MPKIISFSKNRVLEGHCTFDESRSSLAGWALDCDAPNINLKLEVRIDGYPFQTIEENQRCHTLEQHYPANSYHGFNLSLPRERDHNIEVVIKESSSGLEIPGSPIQIAKGITEGHQSNKKRQTVSVNPNNIFEVLKGNRNIHSEHLVLDTNDNCNAECLYCPNPRSSKLISMEQFSELVDSTLAEIGVFQFGCGQEPTMDDRLVDFLALLNQSKLQPRKICMVTNAMLLHKHNITRLEELGLSEIQVSIDTVNEEINNILRRKTDINRIMDNLLFLSDKHPTLQIKFSSTITSINIEGVSELISFGKEVNASFIFREVWDFTDVALTPRDEQYFTWIKALTLKKGEFMKLEQSLRSHPLYSRMEFYPSSAQEHWKSKVEQY